ncbi:MAG: hypothetical protein Q9M48_06845 [Rhodobacterales bacterium]|nr:hypothetical protein [Rhodobacterales bacterium]
MSDIEYFYSAHSAYAYLGAKRVMEIAKAAGRKLCHRPVDLGVVIAATSGRSFGGRSDAHSAYFLVARWNVGVNIAVLRLILPSQRIMMNRLRCPMV